MIPPQNDAIGEIYTVEYNAQDWTTFSSTSTSNLDFIFLTILIRALASF